MQKLKITTLLVLILFISCDTDPKIEEGFLNVGSTSLYYKTIGTGEPIMVLHGGPGFDHLHLLPYIGKLGENYKVILYDQRGGGRSIGPVDSISINIESFIEDIEALRRFFEIDKMNLFGGSWGGILAMFYSIKYPEKLNSLILQGTAASSELMQKMGPTIEKNRTPEDAKILETIRSSEGFKQKDPESLEKYFQVFFKAYFIDQSLASKINLTITENTAKNSSEVQKYMWNSIWPFKLHDSLKVIGCPTLVLHGIKDPIPVESAYKIHEVIPNSELIIFENSGHFVFVEEEERFNTIVGEFLSRVVH